MPAISLVFSSRDSLSCLVHYCLAGKGLPREVIMFVLKSLTKIKEPVWWTHIPLPTNALRDIVSFKLWICFLEWDESSGLSVTLEGGICGGEGYQHCMYSARQMSKKLKEVAKYPTTDYKGIVAAKQSTTLRLEKTLGCDYNMEATMIGEGTWGAPLDSLWRAPGAFLR